VTNDSFNVTAGRWSDLDVLRNDQIAQAGGGHIEIAVQAKAGKAVVAGTLIRYLAKAGALGVDSFNYTYVTNNGPRRTAVVMLGVSAGSCTFNMCGLNKSSGECDAATGRCNCLAGSRLEAKFVLNPSVSARNLTPEVSMPYLPRVSQCAGEQTALQLEHAFIMRHKHSARVYTACAAVQSYRS
jgi:hypothetical protein